MKIAYIFSYFGEGGAEEHALLLAQKARESGNEAIFIISQSSRLALKKLQSEKFQIINLPMNSSFNPLSVLKSAIKLRKTIKSEHIDIVHTHMLREQSLAILAKFFGGKFILVRTFHRLDQFNWKMKPLIWLYSNFTDAFISITEFMTIYLKKNGIKNKIHLIENGVPRINTTKHEQALGFIGRLSPEKGIFNFIKANSDILQKNKLVIAGDGPDFSSIRDLVDKKHLNIELMGRVDEKSDFFSKISVLILPSKTEVLPLVVLEAYSCGLPVVAFNLDPLKGLITTNSGVVVDYPDYKKLGESATKILEKADSFKLANIEKYNSRYSVDIMWRKTFSVYCSLVDKTENMLK